MPPVVAADSRKIALATLIFIACCLLSVFRVLKEAPVPRRGGVVDNVGQRSDARFATLNASGLLPKQGIVGYVGDSGDPSDYYLTQYALAPLVVDHSVNHPLIIGNVSNSPTAPRFDHLQLVNDLGNGVLLFANKDSK